MLTARGQASPFRPARTEAGQATIGSNILILFADRFCSG